MIRRVIYITVLLILGLPFPGSSNVVLHEEESKVEYIQPLGIPVSLSASYGELRRNHFHSGVDLKVGGVVGEPIRAVADGYVSRIGVSPYGYGNALYIDHPDGKTSLYGHMLAYSDEITAYVVERQYERKTFRIDLYPEKGALPVKKGQIIGYVGNTGSSGGPHLHFEIRRTSDQKPLNTIARGYIKVMDDQSPFIRDIVFYGYDRDRLRGWKFASRKNVAEEIIRVPDCFYVAIDAYDRQNGTSNKLGIETYRVLLDGEQIFQMKTGETPFEYTRYINALMEYAEMNAKGRAYIKTKKNDGNLIASKCSYVNDGLVELQDDQVHELKIELCDEHGNRTERVFKVRKDGEMKSAESLPEGTFMSWCMPQIYTEEYGEEICDGGFRVLIDEGSLYNSVYFYAEACPVPAGAFSPLVKLFDPRVPLQKSMKVSVDVDSVPEYLMDKVVLARVLKTGAYASSGGKMVSPKRMEAKVAQFGEYCVVADTIAPVVSADFRSGLKLKGNENLVFRISDELSGILDFNLYIDGEWSLADYDPKTRRVISRVKYSRMKKTGKSHTMKLVVRDGVKNVSEVERTVIF